MIVEVRLFATLRLDRFKKEHRDYPEGVTIESILDDLMIPSEDIAILLVNGRDAHMLTTLIEGDRVSLFPPVGGG